MRFRTIASFALLGQSSCFLVTDLGRFEEDNTPVVTANDFNDLRISLRGMSAHAASPFEYRVVDNANTIQSLGVIQPLGNSETSIIAKRAVPKANGPFHVDLYVNNGTTPGPGWRVNLDEAMRQSTGLFTISVDETTPTADVNAPSPPLAPKASGKAALVRLMNMKPYENLRVEVRIADATAHTVGLYRIPKLPAGTETVDATVPHVIAASAGYEVEVYADDGKASPGTIAAFRFGANASASGLEAVWNANLPGRAVGDAPSP